MNIDHQNQTTIETYYVNYEETLVVNIIKIVKTLKLSIKIKSASFEVSLAKVDTDSANSVWPLV
jgi:hypothetical protein